MLRPGIGAAGKVLSLPFKTCAECMPGTAHAVGAGLRADPESEGLMIGLAADELQAVTELFVNKGQGEGRLSGLLQNQSLVIQPHTPEWLVAKGAQLKMREFLVVTAMAFMLYTVDVDHFGILLRAVLHFEIGKAALGVIGQAMLKRLCLAGREYQRLCALILAGDQLPLLLCVLFQRTLQPACRSVGRRAGRKNLAARQQQAGTQQGRKLQTHG